MKHKKYPKFEDYDFSDCREITGDELYRINGGGRIQPEQNENPPEGDSSNNSDSYTVQSGDTLSQIVYDYNQANGTHLTVDEVAALSGIENPDLIHPGQSIVFSNPEQGGDSGQPVDPTSQGGQIPQTGETSSSSIPNVNPSIPYNSNSGAIGTGYEPPKEIMDNPQAYAYWNAMQDLAAHQGEPDKYKDYNVQGDHTKKQTLSVEKSFFDDLYKGRKLALSPKEQAEMSKLAKRREEGLPAYTIISKDNKAYIKFLDIGSLSDVVKGQSPYISVEEKKSRISDIQKLNNINDKEIFYPGDELLAPNSVVPDITKDLNELMVKNKDDPFIANPFYFKRKVQSGGDWDLKTNKNSIFLTKPLQYKNYIFEGEILRYDAPGNINYGYTGASTWWGTDGLLFWGAGKAQIEDNPNSYWTSDDKYDSYCIQKGIDLYKRNK
ncbi:MAG: LysM peptidoglycan-binding domain-containing protein [Treponema sp.]|nr:LysM peptidoglycan-binding domain-containing protein [Treponema sp.]